MTTIYRKPDDFYTRFTAVSCSWMQSCMSSTAHVRIAAIFTAITTRVYYNNYYYVLKRIERDRTETVADVWNVHARGRYRRPSGKNDKIVYIFFFASANVKRSDDDIV